MRPFVSDTPVLVAIDLSRASQAALIWASNYASKLNAPLEILHVIHDRAGSPGTYKPNTSDTLEPMADVAERKLAEFVNQIREKHPNLPGLEAAKVFCVPGLPGSTIFQFAQAHRAQHVVLGSHQRAGLARLLHGSIASQVASSVTVPVTFVSGEDL
jgi:nucleotide-binding universal stress UspA family protein